MHAVSDELLLAYHLVKHRANGSLMKLTFYLKDHQRTNYRDKEIT